MKPGMPWNPHVRLDSKGTILSKLPTPSATVLVVRAGTGNGAQDVEGEGNVMNSLQVTVLV